MNQQFILKHIQQNILDCVFSYSWFVIEYDDGVTTLVCHIKNMTATPTYQIDNLMVPAYQSIAESLGIKCTEMDLRSK
jgi:hypothetical protein